MKILIIGHPFRMEKIKNVLEDSFNDIEAEFIEFFDYSDTDIVQDTVKNNKNNIVAVLFTGELAFSWFNSKMVDDIIFDYMHKDSSSLLKILLQALSKGYNIFNISIDSFDKHLVYETYEELEIDKGIDNVYICPKAAIQGNTYLDDIYSFHKINFLKKKVSFCVTAISPIYTKLSNEGIPCYLFQPSKDMIKNTILKIKLKHEIQVKENNQLVCISLEIDMPNEESLINENEYQLMLEYMNVSKEVYILAQKIQAAVQVLNFKQFTLFSTKKLLDTETENLGKFEIFKMVNQNTLSSISMGVGYGKTAREAKNNSSLGLLKAKKYSGNKAFIIYDAERKIGPIDYLKKSKSELDSTKIDEKFLNIGEKCNISINTIFKLFNIIQQYKKDSFTPHELAKYFGTSTRTIYRIIDKLEQNGFAKVVGKKIISNTGRPSRLYRLLLY